MFQRVFGLFIFFTNVFVFGQQTITALRTNEKIHIDGNITEMAWTKVIPVGNFVQFKPHPGDSSAQRTEVRVIYDDQALYVSAICYDNPEHVSKILSQRDDFNANDPIIPCGPGRRPCHDVVELGDFRHQLGLGIAVEDFQCAVGFTLGFKFTDD